MPENCREGSGPSQPGRLVTSSPERRLAGANRSSVLSVGVNTASAIFPPPAALVALIGGVPHVSFSAQWPLV